MSRMDHVDGHSSAALNTKPQAKTDTTRELPKAARETHQNPQTQGGQSTGLDKAPSEKGSRIQQRSGRKEKRTIEAKEETLDEIEGDPEPRAEPASRQSPTLPDSIEPKETPSGANQDASDTITTKSVLNGPANHNLEPRSSTPSVSASIDDSMASTVPEWVTHLLAEALESNSNSSLSTLPSQSSPSQSHSTQMSSAPRLPPAEPDVSGFETVLMSSGPSTGIGAGTGTFDLFLVHDLPPHRDEPQVLLDIKRLFTATHLHMCPGHLLYTAIMTPDDMARLRRRLFCLVVRVLRKYPALHYYQGYHDIASMVLVGCDELSDDDAFAVLETLTLRHLRDFMLADIALSINHLKLVPVVVEHADPDFAAVLAHASAAHAATLGLYYDYKFLPALLSILTLFGHDIANPVLLMQVWDFIFARGTVAAAAYVYAAALLEQKQHILSQLRQASRPQLPGSQNQHLEDTEIDTDLLHTLVSPASLLANLSTSSLDTILQRAASLMDSLSLDSQPDTFCTWFGRFNVDSVLMTTSPATSFSKPVDLSSPEAVETLLLAQSDQQQQESVHESLLFNGALAKLDSSMSSSVESSFGNSSLFSLLSLTTAASRLDLGKWLSILKTNAPIREDKDKGRHPARRLGIYKISLAVGLMGLLLHFLLNRDAPRRFPEQTARLVWLHVAYAASQAVLDAHLAYSAVKESAPVRDAFELTKIGLGFMK